jgi:hypothetical protein
MQSRKVHKKFKHLRVFCTLLRHFFILSQKAKHSTFGKIILYAISCTCFN